MRTWLVGVLAAAVVPLLGACGDDVTALANGHPTEQAGRPLTLEIGHCYVEPVVVDGVLYATAGLTRASTASYVATAFS